MNDPISDLIIRIKNSQTSGNVNVTVPYSKLKENILKVMRENGYVKSYEVKKSKNYKFIVIDVSENKITHIRRISKPGHRIYTKTKNIPRPLRGFGLVVISTPKGILSGKEARKSSLGGELIFELW